MVRAHLCWSSSSAWLVVPLHTELSVYFLVRSCLQWGGSFWRHGCAMKRIGMRPLRGNSAPEPMPYRALIALSDKFHSLERHRIIVPALLDLAGNLTTPRDTRL